MTVTMLIARRDLAERVRTHQFLSSTLFFGLLAVHAAGRVSSPRVGATIGGTAALLFMLNVYGSWIAADVARERASRVTEVLALAVHPSTLLAGKVVGLGALAVLQVTVVTTTVIATAGSRLDLGMVAWSLLWFVLGYALYCTAFAAIGTRVRPDSTPVSTLPVMLPFVVGYGVATSALTAGTATPLLRWASFFPPTAPAAMPVRLALGDVGVVGVVAVAVLTVAATSLMFRIGAARFAAPST